jgi:di/tricarboxylate transporter
VIGFNPLQVCYLLVGAAIFVLAAWIELADHPVRRPIRKPNTLRR